MEINTWIKAFRLRTLPLAFSVIIAGNALVLDKYFNCVVFFLALLTTLFLQLLSNLANDYGDFKKGTDNEKRVGPERALQSGKISESQMKKAIALFSIFSFAGGILLLLMAFGIYFWKEILVFTGIGLLCIAAAIKYTAGKFAYGYRALGDIAVILFFGIIGVCGSYYLQSKTISIEVFILAFAYGLWCTAVLNLNNMRDADNDIVCGKKTIAWLLGFRGAKIYHLILLFLPYVFMVIVFYPHSFTFILLLLLPLSILQGINVWRAHERKQFDKWLPLQAITTFLNAILLMILLHL